MEKEDQMGIRYSLATHQCMYVLLLRSWTWKVPCCIHGKLVKESAEQEKYIIYSVRMDNEKNRKGLPVAPRKVSRVRTAKMVCMR